MCNRNKICWHVLRKSHEQLKGELLATNQDRIENINCDRIFNLTNKCQFFFETLQTHPNFHYVTHYCKQILNFIHNNNDT